MTFKKTGDLKRKSTWRNGICRSKETRKYNVGVDSKN